MATRCSLKNVASYSPVRLMYGRKTNQSNLPIVHLIARCALWSVKYDNCISRRASLCAYQILHSFSTKNVWILLKTFMCYVRPKLEYCTCVWNPYLKKDILLLESVQKNLLVIFACVVTFHLLPILIAFTYLVLNLLNIAELNLTIF